MGRPEQFSFTDQGGQLRREILSPHHFYAAYIFDPAEARKDDVIAIVQEARRLGYPVRYWWLSDAMDLQGDLDRLIVCVHHPSGDENAGTDLHDALTERRITWDDLEAAAVDEYRYFSKPIESPEGICKSDGTTLFPPGLSGEKRVGASPPA